MALRRDELPPLKGVVAVTRRVGASVAALPHVLGLISAFVDASGTWSLVRACESVGSVSLLRRLHARERPMPPIDPFFRGWQFNRSIAAAARRGDLDVIKWLTTEYAPGTLITDGVEAAAEHGHLHIIKWFHDECRQRAVFGILEMWLAAKNGHLEVFQWLHERTSQSPAQVSEATGREVCDNDFDYVFGCRTEFKCDLLSTAGADGHLRVVQWLAHKIDERVQAQQSQVGARQDEAASDSDKPAEAKRIQYTYDIYHTALNGHLDVLEWLDAVNFSWLEIISSDVVWQVLTKGRVDTVKWIYKRFYANDHPDAVEPDNKAGNGPLELLQFMYSAGMAECPEDAMKWAVGTGRVDLLRWLYENDREYCWGDLVVRSAMEQAAREGHLDVLKFLFETQPEGIRPMVMPAAAGRNQRAIVEWWRQIQPHGDLECPVEAAASSGHIEMAVWLLRNCGGICTTSAMDIAAMHGHLDMVKWLHDHGTAGCTTSAMNQAATRGRLDIVRWLHDNRTEGCTAYAMNNAASRGHLHVVRWLHEHRTEGCTTIAMDEAASFGHFDVVLFLHQHREEGCSRRAFQGALVRGHLEIVRWLAANYPQHFDREALFRLCQGVYSLKPHVAAWLRSGER